MGSNIHPTKSTGGIPIGGVIMVPYKNTADGNDDTNVNVLAEYPENFIRPAGQILSIADYQELRDLIGAGRVFALSANGFTGTGGWTVSTSKINLYGATVAENQFFHGNTQASSGSNGAVTWRDITGEVGNSAQGTGDTFYCIRTAGTVSDDDTVAAAHQWRDNSYATNATITPKLFTIDGTFTPSVGTITQNTKDSNITHFWIGTTCHVFISFYDNFNAHLDAIIYRSTNQGATWTSNSYAHDRVTAGMVNAVTHTWHNADGMANSLCLLQRGELGRSFLQTSTTGAGTGLIIYIVAINDAGEVTETDYNVGNSSGFGGAGGFVVGDQVTFTNAAAGTVVIEIDAVSSGRISTHHVVSSTNDWVGSLTLSEAVSNNTWTDRLTLTEADGFPGSMREFTNTNVDFDLHYLDGNHYFATESSLRRSTDNGVNWTVVTLPTGANPLTIAIDHNQNITIAHEGSVNNGQGWWSADGLTWDEADTWGIDIAEDATKFNRILGGGSLAYFMRNNGSNAIYATIMTDILDETIEFQIPNVPDPNTDGLGAGLYPLLRIK